MLSAAVLLHLSVTVIAVSVSDMPALAFILASFPFAAFITLVADVATVPKFGGETRSTRAGLLKLRARKDLQHKAPKTRCA